MITVTTTIFSMIISYLELQYIVYMTVGLDFPQHWTKLNTTGGPRPPARDSHAACCIAGPLPGQEHPLLLVGGGFSGSALKDMWLLDVDRGVWSEVSGLVVWCMMDCIKSVCYKYVLLLTYMWLCALNLLLQSMFSVGGVWPQLLSHFMNAIKVGLCTNICPV